MMRIFLWTLLLLAPSSLFAALLNVPNARPKVSYDWRPALELTWQGIKARNIDAYTTGLVHRPKADGSIGPGDAVSEGQGYGMMVALYAGDQATFNQIWTASEKYMWSSSNQSLNWRVKPDGSWSGDGGAATDADQDVAAMLILADSLVSAGKWNAYSLPNNGPGYAERAQVMLNRIWSSMVVNSNGKYYLKPGDGWNGSDKLNPGYFTPAFYRIFKDFDSNTAHNWSALIDNMYELLNATSGASKGLLPDWCDASGALLASGPGYNAYDNGHSMFKDAIRILWRVGTDAVWFNEPRAKAFLKKSIDFLETKGGASAANYFTMTGEFMPTTDTWTFNGGATVRKRWEHSHLTIGMWAAATMAVGTDVQREAMSNEMQKFYGTGNKFFGLVTDPSGALEDTAHNEMYFDQFLAWFGTSLMAGAYSNILYDIANPPAGGAIHSERHALNPLHIQVNSGLVQILTYSENRVQVFNLKGEPQNGLIKQNGGTWLWPTEGRAPGIYWVKSGAETTRFILP